MKTLASITVIVVALACCACGGGAAPEAKAPESQPVPQAQPAPEPKVAAASSDLPEQFQEHWTVGLCPNQGNTGTGLESGDIIEVANPVGLKITLGLNNPRKPDPKQIENAKLTIVQPENVTNQNVLTPEDVSLLCTAGARGFKTAFGTVLAQHDFRLTYLIGVSELHPGHSSLVIFLPYVDATEPGSRFFLAVLDLSGNDSEKARFTHNGIVHGMP